MNKKLLPVFLVLAVLALFSLACGPLTAAINAALEEMNISTVDPDSVEEKVIIITGQAAAPDAVTTPNVTTEIVTKDVLSVDWINNTGAIVSAELFIPGFTPKDTIQIIVHPGQRLVASTAHSLRIWVFHGYTAAQVLQDIMVNSARPLYELDVNGDLVLVADLSARQPESGGDITNPDPGAGDSTCKGKLGNANEGGLTAIPNNCWAVVDSWGEASTAPEGETVDVIVRPGTVLTDTQGRKLLGSVYLYPDEAAARLDLATYHDNHNPAYWTGQ